MFLCSLTDEISTKEENDKTGCNFNFGHECNILTCLKVKMRRPCDWVMSSTRKLKGSFLQVGLKREERRSLLKEKKNERYLAEET